MLSTTLYFESILLGNTQYVALSPMIPLLLVPSKVETFHTIDMLLPMSKMNASDILWISWKRKHLEIAGFHHSKENSEGNKTLMDYLDYKLLKLIIFSQKLPLKMSTDNWPNSELHYSLAFRDRKRIESSRI